MCSASIRGVTLPDCGPASASCSKRVGFTPACDRWSCSGSSASYYDDPEDPTQLLDTVGLSDATRATVRRLSGGQRQRLSLATALIGKPSVVSLDEPTAGMDPRARATTWRLVRDLAQRGVTVLRQRMRRTKPSSCVTGSRSSAVDES